MFRFSAKTIVILAAVCFLALAALQVAWIISAYEGEKALYTRAKKQFEAELQSELAKNDEVKKGLKELIAYYRKENRLTDEQKAWFHFNFVQVIDFSPKKQQFDVYVYGVSIARHNHKGSRDSGIITLIGNIYENPDAEQIKNAGKLCVHCIVEEKEDSLASSDYEVLLFYKEQWPAFFDKLGFLIVGSLLLLILLVFLFREIIKLYRSEKKLSEAKNDFINNLTHEMQTPVFAIQMANRLIKEKAEKQTGILPLISIIEKETGQLKAHATRILELASLEGAQVELRREVIELNKFLEEKKPTIELMLQPYEGVLEVRYHPNSLYIEIDPIHFNNLVLSLADNSIKYSEGVPHITIETGEMNNKVFIRFTDKGIGIKKEYLPYITDKFFRVPHVKRPPGFGLGLSYVKHIVELHGGELKLSSEKDVGTIVTILVPKAKAHA